MIWGIFKAAVWRAQDERAQEVRRTRALERIAGALEYFAENGMLPPSYQDEKK
jgi:hypothetical protein